MSAAKDDYPDVLYATESDLRVAVRRALMRANLTFAQLKEQADAGRFETLQARRAWVAIGDLGHLADK